MAERWPRLRGLRALVEEVVDQGTAAVGRAHLGTTGRTFTILEHVPPIAAPVRVVRIVYEGATGATYDAVRAVNYGVGRVLEASIDVADAVTRDSD